MGKHHYRDGENIPNLEDHSAEFDPVPVCGNLLEGVPTQVLYPWRTALRTLFQYIAGLAVTAIIAWSARTLGVDLSHLSAELTGSLAAIIWGIFTMFSARVMAIPAVNNWLARFIPFLAANTQSAPAGDDVAGEVWNPAPETGVELPDVVVGDKTQGAAE